MGRWAIINGLLVVFVLLLGLQIGRIWSRSLPTVDVVARPIAGPTPKAEGGKSKRGDKGAAAKAAESTPAVMVTAIVERDLFDPTRARPSEEAKVVAAPVVQPPQNVQISGVRVLGKDREAFVLDNGQSRRVRVGDQVQGYIVKTIRVSEIVMASPSGDPVSLSLAVEKGKGASVPGAKAPTPRPGQPPVPGGPASPAAGIPTTASPAAGVQAPKPAVARTGVPPIPGIPAVQPVPVPPQPGPVPPGNNPNMQIPHQVRDSLERFKEQQRERREKGNK